MMSVDQELFRKFEGSNEVQSENNDCEYEATYSNTDDEDDNNLVVSDFKNWSIRISDMDRLKDQHRQRFLSSTLLNLFMENNIVFQEALQATPGLKYLNTDQVQSTRKSGKSALDYAGVSKLAFILHTKLPYKHFNFTVVEKLATRLLVTFYESLNVNTATPASKAAIKAILDKIKFHNDLTVDYRVVIPNLQEGGYECGFVSMKNAEDYVINGPQSLEDDTRELQDISGYVKDTKATILQLVENCIEQDRSLPQEQFFNKYKEDKEAFYEKRAISLEPPKKKKKTLPSFDRHSALLEAADEYSKTKKQSVTFAKKDSNPLSKNAVISAKILFPGVFKLGKEEHTNVIDLPTWGELHDYERLVWYYGVITGFGFEGSRTLLGNAITEQRKAGILAEMLLQVDKETSPFKEFPMNSCCYSTLIPKCMDYIKSKYDNFKREHKTLVTDKDNPDIKKF
ncbi:vacuolar amino acid transporter [Acrasis kona]|uniref:Vacuolar amino acid transporter n=1 Tax=Acrasis kona TaxID=1008807 RepID=A0AAW2ZFL2_9EUKA